MKNNIKALRVRAGLTQAQLADLTGVGIPQVSKWENGRVDIPTSRLTDLAKALKTNPDTILSDRFAYSNQSFTRPSPDEPIYRMGKTSIEPAASIEPNAKVVHLEDTPASQMQGNLPIFGTALGAPREIDGDAIEQVTLNKAEVLEYVKRPVILNDNHLAYGLRVEGYSMEPRHRDGEMLIVDPLGRIKIGEDVVVYLRPTSPEEDDGETARAVLVKRIVRRSSGFIELEQYQPAKTFRIDMQEVLRIDRVMPWQELLG